MAHKKNTTNLTELLLQCVTQPDPEYAGMAVYTPHGGRGRSAVGRREKSAHGRQERIPQRLSSSPSGYPNGHDAPHGAQSSSGRLHSVLRHRAQAQ